MAAVSLRHWRLPDGGTVYVPDIKPPQPWSPAAGRAWARLKQRQRQVDLARRRPLEPPPATGHRYRRRMTEDEVILVCRSCDWATFSFDEADALGQAEQHRLHTAAAP